MQSSSSASAFRQQFIPLLPDPCHRTRQHSAPSTIPNASIWAPQPQSPGGTWTGNIHGHPEHPGQLERVPGVTPLGFPLAIAQKPLTKEEVFGPPPGVLLSNHKEVGAIGDGRQRDSLFYESEHVEQLLRSLNLNSPVPECSPSAFDYNVSPTTSSSFPTTPVESSPTTPSSSDTFFNQLCELGSSVNMRSNALTPSSSVFSAPLKTAQETIWTEANIGAQGVCQRGNHDLARFMYQSAATFDSSLDVRTSAMFGGDGSDQRRIDWQQHTLPETSDWNQLSPSLDGSLFGTMGSEADIGRHGLHERPRGNAAMPMSGSSHLRQQQQSGNNEPINFLSLLHPSSTPPYALFVSRIVKSSDQQASIFLQQKLKVADDKERQKIVDAICTRGTEMMSHRFGNWAVQRCLEAASSAEERRKIASCMRGHVVELATNCYGCHVLQKALDCEEDIRLLIVSELLLGDPAKTLINKHASHVWSKIMEISWTPPAPPIFTYVNKALQGKWASLACHETGSLVVQHAFENLEDSAKDGIVDELLNRGQAVFADVAKNQWGSYCIQHILEHGSLKHKDLALSHLLTGLLEFSANEQGFKSVIKALKEGGKDVLDKFVQRMREAPKGGRRAIIVDLALSTTGSQLLASVLPNVDRDQRALLYDAIRGHIVTLRGCKTGSKVIWLFDRMRVYYGS